jgi:hypothetical protein
MDISLIRFKHPYEEQDKEDEEDEEGDQGIDLYPTDGFRVLFDEFEHDRFVILQVQL